MFAGRSQDEIIKYVSLRDNVTVVVSCQAGVHVLPHALGASLGQVQAAIVET